MTAMSTGFVSIIGEYRTVVLCCPGKTCGRIHTNLGLSDHE